MTLGECATYIRGMQRKEQEEWERTRMLMYIIAQVNSTKELTPKDLMKFPWEEQEAKVEINEEELANLREKARKMEKIMNKK